MAQPLHVCLICVEIFAWGRKGGFGRATRTIGRELVGHGVQVTAIVPRRENQQPVEMLDGIRVLSFKPYDLPGALKLYREAGADIYHSQEPSLGTYLAQRAAPERKHIITCRDTRDAEDWRIERELPSLNKLQVISNQLYEDNLLVKRALLRADGVFAASYVVQQKAHLKYGLKEAPVFLPTPVAVPEKVQKAETPTVCFVSRMDRRKRPELFFELALRFPQVRFIAIGSSRDPEWNQYLMDKYGRISNLEMLGFVDQFRGNTLSETLEKSWALINTSAREGLPNAFVEAAAHRCAILSTVDPDGFASQFGYFASQDDLAEGLSYLLENDRWRAQGERGWEHICQVFATDKAIDRHLDVYRQMLEREEGKR